MMGPRASQAVSSVPVAFRPNGVYVSRTINRAMPLHNGQREQMVSYSRCEMIRATSRPPSEAAICMIDPRMPSPKPWAAE